MLKRSIGALSRLLQTHDSQVNFSDICGLLAEAMGASVYLFNIRGKVLGQANFDSDDGPWFQGKRLTATVNSLLLHVAVAAQIGDVEGRQVFVVPVIGAGKRRASLVVDKAGGCTDDDQILIQAATMAIGLVVTRVVDEQADDEALAARLAKSGVKSLSYSEVLAMQHILDELDGDEGFFVAGRISEQAKITRSVIVNALRKLASAELVESRSLGMKGTYLKVTNKAAINELRRQQLPRLNDK